MSEHHLHIVKHVLDEEVVDANHMSCGRVDDIEIDFSGKQPKVTAILIGNGPASDRLPELARVISRKLFGRRKVKVPWSEVSVITTHIKLAKDAKEYGLDERKGLAYDIISKLPGAWRK